MRQFFLPAEQSLASGLYHILKALTKSHKSSQKEGVCRSPFGRNFSVFLRIPDPDLLPVVGTPTGSLSDVESGTL